MCVYVHKMVIAKDAARYIPNCKLFFKRFHKCVVTA